MKKINLYVTLVLMFFSLGSFSQEKKLLVFSKTMGFRHQSIEKGKAFFENWAKTAGYHIDFTENSADFNEDNLKKYNAVIFLSTTGDVLSPAQQADFERYIQAGGGYVGIHAASDTEYDWPWYNELMGGYFASHPGGSVSNVQNGKMIVLDKNHPSTAHLPETFERKDEFYDFKSLKKDILNFLIRVDENSYQMGKMGDFHPLAWYHEYDGGKSFYTNYGHTDETFDEPLMQKHITEGVKWAMADKLDYSKARTKRAPEENRFIKTTLINNLDEPTELAIMPNGKVIFTERKGAVKVWSPTTQSTKVVGNMNAYTKFEYGVMGIGIDPNFDKNNWVYIYYTPETDPQNANVLSRFVYDQTRDTLLFDTEKVLLRVPVKRIECCHTGGSIDWDAKGNLFLSTGDDTNPFASDGYAPIDFREDRRGWDALSTAGNTNDLRGKVLRITPQPDGTYTIPEGNLFSPPATAGGVQKKWSGDTPPPSGDGGLTRPEIFVMGCRNPYRIAVDKRTGFLYWGDVGPDAGKADPNRGPDGQVEFNQARKAGYFGWPLFVGNNDAYNRYDFENKVSGAKFDPSHPLNESPHNTGLKELPPTTRPLVWYGYDVSKRFPLLEKGGANPMAGPVYYSGDYANSPAKFPSYYDGKFFAYEWMRDWIITFSLDKDGNYIGMERFMPSTKFYHPMDMAFDKNGRLFMLEYGLNWFAQNEEAALSVIEHNAGNRKPIVRLSADKEAGATPLTVNFSSEGTLDYDGDALTYLWEFKNESAKMKPLKTANPSVIFKKPGVYEAVLTVTDAVGNSNKESVFIKVGNEVPSVSIALNGNKTFFFDNEKIDYEVKIKDKEDGTIGNGISPEDVAVSINYLEGYDKTLLEQGHKANESLVAGKRLIELSDCKACHSITEKSIGPAYLDVAAKYSKSSQNITALSEKIIAGGGGVWGEQAMAAHPQISKNDAREMVEYILSLRDKKVSEAPAALYEPKAHKGKKEGAYLIQASYTDKGSPTAAPQTATAVVALRSAKIPAVSYDVMSNSGKFNVPNIGEIAIGNDGGYIGFNQLDLTDIHSLMIGAFSTEAQTAGGTIDVRLGSQTGKVLGTLTIPLNSIMPQKVELKDVPAGENDLYFVFSNPKAEGKPLFGISTIEFKK